jgi:hypothetical protein
MTRIRRQGNGSSLQVEWARLWCILVDLEITDRLFVYTLSGDASRNDR